ncbi:MAG: uracil-xanthine permease [Anaerofustis stercorihominis]|nr:uracil-xanthine permease [Anaerofustis stercorihominis]
MKKITAQELLLAIQHLFAMFGATVLVPLLTGLSPSVALVAAGAGTLLFHLITNGKVPVFLGSSFAFIGALATVVSTKGISYAQGGVIVAGLVYAILAMLVKVVGAEQIKKFFPPVVTGPVIMVIGVSLSYCAINDSSGVSSGLPAGISWLVAFFVLVIVVICNFSKNKMINLVPILIGMASGYALCVVLKMFGINIIDFTPIANAEWINIPYITEGFFSLPKFDLASILTIAPVALVTFMEHIGDITTNGAVVGKDFFKDPGLHRTLLGDGLATALAGFIGGPPNTTYSENTGVLATTKNYDPRLLRITAIIAIILGFFGKFGAVLQTIPGPVKGGVEIILFGMISSVGIRTMIDAKLDFTKTRNLIIVALILVFGIGITISTYSGGSVAGISVNIFGHTMNFSALFVATVVGVLANIIIPEE